jgi:hypothetical protein
MMDGLGLHMFDGANFENMLEQLISHWPESHQQYSSALLSYDLALPNTFAQS